MNNRVEGMLDSIIRFMNALDLAAVQTNKRLEALQATVESQNKLIDKLADRLIQMAMVKQGMGREAAGHRRSEQTSGTAVDDDLWTEEKEGEWPPPGHDALTMP